MAFKKLIRITHLEIDFFFSLELRFSFPKHLKLTLHRVKNMLTRSAILVLAEKRTQEMCRGGELGFTPQEAREHNHCLTYSLDWWSTNLFGSKSSLWHLSVPFSARWFLLGCLWLHSSLRQILPWIWWFRCPLLGVLCNIFLWNLVVLFETKKADMRLPACVQFDKAVPKGGRGRAKTLGPTRIHQSHHSY